VPVDAALLDVDGTLTDATCNTRSG